MMDVRFFSKLKDSNAIRGKKKEDIPIEIGVNPASLFFKIKGFGDYSSSKGHGIPIILEYYEGRLRLLVWQDINNEEPTVIDLEAARESNRIEIT